VRIRRRAFLLFIAFVVAHFTATYFAFTQLFVLAWYDPQDVILAQKIWQTVAYALSVPFLWIIIRINSNVAFESMSLWVLNSVLSVSAVCFLLIWMRRLHQHLNRKGGQAQ
jgi:hypothetical protein